MPQPQILKTLSPHPRNWGNLGALALGVVILAFLVMVGLNLTTTHVGGFLEEAGILSSIETPLGSAVSQVKLEGTLIAGGLGIGDHVYQTITVESG